MLKYLILLVTATLFIGCEEQKNEPEKPQISLEEWKKSNHFVDSVKIESLGITALYNVVKVEESFKVKVDFLPDTAFVKQKVEFISQKTGLKNEELAIYLSITREFDDPGKSRFTTVVSPIDLFLKSAPLFTARKMLIANKNPDFLFPMLGKGNPFVVKVRVAPFVTIESELRKSGVITSKNESDYIFENFEMTNVGSQTIHLKSSYSI